MDNTLASFTDVLDDEICDSQPLSLTSSIESNTALHNNNKVDADALSRPVKGTGQRGHFRSTDEIDPKYRDVFTYPYFNLIQSKVIDDALYSDKSIVVCAPTGSGKTVVFEMAIVQLLMELEDKHYTEDFKIIYMAPVKALCTERLTEWYPKFTKLGLLCIEATGDTDVDFTQLKPYKIIITTPEKWDMLTRRWRDHRSLVEDIKLFLIDEVHILNDESRGPVLEAVVSRMKTIESSAQSVHRIERLQNQLHGSEMTHKTAPSIRFVAVSATVSNPEDVANWLGTTNKPAVFHKFGDECRPVKLKRIVEGYPCPEGTSIFKFDIILNYKLWPIIQKYHSGKPTLIFCNTRKSVVLTAETLSRELTINFSAEQKAKLTALASTIKNKKLQSLVLSGVGCHHAGLLYEERQNIQRAFTNRDLPILITTTTLAMGVNLPAHLVIIKNTMQYVNGAYQEYSISTVLQMVGRAGRPQFDTHATAVIMTRLVDKARYQALVGGCEPLQSFLHKRLPENLNSEAALGTVGDVAQCVQWLRSTFLYVRAARDPKKYLNLPQNSPQHLISKKIEELCVRAMNSLASSGLITMDEASCIESTEAGRLMSIFYLDLETMKLLIKIEGTESLDRLLTLICESHELSDMHLRVDERRCLNALNRNNAAATIRFPMKGKITTRQMKLNCIIQAVLGCLAIPDPSLNQEAMKIMRTADRVCKCLVAYVTRSDLISHQPQFYSAVLNSIVLAKCIAAHLWENSPFVSKQLKGIGPTFSTLLATAGKINFMLLEESHPRDLERIMNKGAPAGNIIRKQVSLLPKYQLSMIPVDESTVSVQLVLLNQNFLSENMEQLTAGSTHSSYIVVGDSINHLLLLVSFKDKDLISVFDGTITHEIKRKHNYEHKIFAHCISTSFVGIDVQSDYVFNDLNQFIEASYTHNNKREAPIKGPLNKQTCITDTFKERKRKSTSDKTHSKEKKKRDNALMENFKYLKKTFETASKNVKDNVNLPYNNNIHREPNHTSDTITKKLIEHKDIVNEEFNKIGSEITVNEAIDSDDFIDDEKVDSILTEIENEMSKKKANSINTDLIYVNNTRQVDTARISTSSKFQTPVHVKQQKRRKSSHAKSNYTFMELLERDIDLTDDDEKAIASNKKNGFSDTIKCQINKYIQRTENKANTLDTHMKLLLESEDKETSIIYKKLREKVVEDSDSEEALPSIQKLYPCYEIKEILGGQNAIEKNMVVMQTEKEFKNANGVIASPEKIDKESPPNESYEKKTYATNDKCFSMINDINLSELSLTEETVDRYMNKCDDEYKSNSDMSYVDDQLKTNSLSDTLKEDLNKLNSNYQERIEITQSEYFPVKQNVRDDIVENNLNVPAIQSNNPSLVSSHNIYSRKIHKLNEVNAMAVVTSKYLNNETIGDNNQSSIPFFGKHSYKNTEPNYTYTLENDVKKDIDDRSNNTLYNVYSNANASKVATNTDLNIVSNLPYSNENNSPNFIYNCLEANLSYYSEISSNEYKTNVSSKQSPEFCVQVVQKIKVDLNITKIISNSQPHPSHISNFKNKPGYMNEVTREKLVEPSFDNLQSCCQNVNKLNPIMYRKQTIKEYFETATSNNKKHQILDSELATKQNCVMPLQNNASYGSMNKDLQERHDFDVMNAKVDFNAVDMNPTNKDKSQCLTKLEDSPDSINEKITTRKESDHEIKTGNSEVQNILQKYSKILAKDTSKTPSAICPAIHRNIACNKSSVSKNNKPFKISDIQKLDATLPETIIDCNTRSGKQNVPRLPKVANNEPIIKEHLAPEQYTPCYNVDPIDNDVLYHPISDMDLEPVDIPNTEIDLEPVIDQSMFDPKTLIQCTIDADSEEIIPPPPQFCDSTPHSPDYNDTDDSNSQCGESQLSYNTDTNLNYDENIFAEQCITHLTPSSEIETWTLAEADRWQDRYSSPSPAKSFTVVRRNTSDSYDLSGNKTKSRQAKLGQFKFNHRNKLRRWK